MSGEITIPNQLIAAGGTLEGVMSQEQQEALSLIKEGFGIIPLHRMVRGICTCGKFEDCGGKHPVSSFSNFTIGTVDEVYRWWNENKTPPYNIGVRCDKSYCWVLYIDGPE